MVACARLSLTSYNEGLPRRSEAAKGLSSRRCLRHRGGFCHPDSFSRISGLGIAQLEFASGHRIIVDRFPDRTRPCLGVRHHAARHSSYAKFSRLTSTAQSHHLVAVGLAISALAGFFLLPHVLARKIDTSIAVLPFQNLSDEKESAYFADGVQDGFRLTKRPSSICGRRKIRRPTCFICRRTITEADPITHARRAKTRNNFTKKHSSSIPTLPPLTRDSRRSTAGPIIASIRSRHGGRKRDWPRKNLGN
jgi:hypothetical protein